MVRVSGSPRTHGSFADFTAPKEKPLTGVCQRCGAGLRARTSPKKYCAPCSDIVIREQNRAAAKRRYVAKCDKERAERKQ